MDSNERRLELQSILERVLGSRNVYYQPPESLLLQYPCIVYSKSFAAKRRADNRLYLYKQAYDMTYIDHDPDSPTVDVLRELPLCEWERSYTSDGLNHDAFTIYH